MPPSHSNFQFGKKNLEKKTPSYHTIKNSFIDRFFGAVKNSSKLRKAATKTNIPLCRYRLAAGPPGARWWSRTRPGGATPTTTPLLEQRQLRRTASWLRRKSRRPSKRRSAPRLARIQRGRPRHRHRTRLLRKTSHPPPPHLSVAQHSRSPTRDPPMALHPSPPLGALQCNFD